jgi:hypothetical protein
MPAEPTPALNSILQDYAADDTDIRDLARPILGTLAVDGDEHAVPTLPGIVARLIERINNPTP